MADSTQLWRPLRALVEAYPAWVGHPVYRLARRRTGGSVLAALRMGCLPAVLAAAGLAATTALVMTATREIGWSVESAVRGALTLLLVLLVIIQVVAGAASNVLVLAETAPLVAAEVEMQSWGVLRSTALSVREILLAKLSAALANLRAPLAALTILRAATTGTVLLVVAFSLARDSFYYDERAWRSTVETGRWVLPALAGLVGTAWFLAQPRIQFGLNGALGLLVSTLTRSRGRALAAALAGRVMGWALSIILNIGVIYGLGYLLLENWADPAFAPIRAFRGMQAPPDWLVTQVIAGGALLYILGVAVLQLGITQGALVVAARRAGQIAG